MKLALFDLDHTLLNGDSDTAWASYLIDLGILDSAVHTAETEAFYQSYLTGGLDIQGWLRFQLGPLTRYPLETLYAWRKEFIETRIRPMVMEEGIKIIEQHRSQGDEMIMVTATNDFVTEPIAKLLGFDHLIASQAERDSQGGYTGRPSGTPSYKEGKVIRLKEWLAEHNRSLSDYDTSWFYSDSHNDIPLLSIVTYPVAVNPDPTLLKHARAQGWQIADFKREGIPAA